MIRAIAKEHQKSNPDRVVDVTIQDGIMVQGDPYLMKIALENLVDNAFKFTGKDSTSPDRIRHDRQGWRDGLFYPGQRCGI